MVRQRNSSSTLKSLNADRACMLMPPWMPWCYPVANPPPCESPVSTNRSWMACLTGWSATQNGLFGHLCGAILLATPGEGRSPFLAAGIARNAWGRQRESFEAVLSVDLETPSAAFKPAPAAGRDKFDHQPLEVASQGAKATVEGFPGVFIRAPRFDGNAIDCTPVAWLDDEVVGVLDGSKLGVTFHPELTLDRRFHRWLLATAKHCMEASV